jgi:DNA mismatch repair ATPase MutS
MVELNEMKNIINRSDSNTLVLADELCRGTEY